MSENINLCELLKGHEGEMFYSTICGNVILKEIKDNEIFPIHISYYSNDKRTTYLTKDGRWWSNGECVLFPSKDQRDWNKWVKEQKSKPIIPKTWKELVESSEGLYSTIQLIENIENNYYYNISISIHKSTLALLKIHQLIEVGYGGNITNEEWKIESYKSCIYIENGIIKAGSFVKQKHHIAFHTLKQAKEFLSYHENIQLIKDFYMIL